MLWTSETEHCKNSYVFFIAQVEAVQHFLFGIAIDEGFKGPQANTLAWDVLYPEVKDVKIIWGGKLESSYSLHCS